LIQPYLQRSRRYFLWFLGVGGSAAVSSSLLAGQAKRKFPQPPTPSDPSRGSEQPVTMTDAQAAQRAQLKLNEKEFRESLASLYDRVNELKQDTDAQHTSEFFSVKMYKQTGEIEHLAKKLRSLARV